MKISESWLREWVNPSIGTDELVAQLTMAGLEVDGVEKTGNLFSGVVVGEIIEATQHPDADKLRVCKVEGHPEGEKQVVCGAPNARVGLKIPFATVGAELPGDFKIKKAKLRGVESFGMLCGQTELQLGDDDSGLWELPADAPVGKDLVDYLQLADQIIEVDLTPNRGDCLSVRGIAREVACLNNLAFDGFDVPAVQPQIDDTVNVVLKNTDACPFYAGRVIRHIDASKPTPLWMVEKLRRSGIRSINAVVDVTNYVLIELGQPMHAFDMEKLTGSIQVRQAKSGEQITLLDKREIDLQQGTLVIADDKGPLAIAGVMGGLDSGVTAQAQHIFLESAFFQPTAIAGKARAYAAHTDSSHRFERGVDVNLQAVAIERATQLLLEIVGGQPGPVTIVSDNVAMPKERSVTLALAKVNAYLGHTFTAGQVHNILTRLGLKVLQHDEASWTFLVPSHRFDIAEAVDLIEEIARIHGYDNLPTRALSFPPPLLPRSEQIVQMTDIKRHLVTRGFQEAITYSFIDPKLHQVFFPDSKPVELRNPISADMSQMRLSLVPSLVQTLQSNINRQHNRAKLFESGLCFDSPDGSLAKLSQTAKIGALIYGSIYEDSWAEKARDVDFFDIKGDVESLLSLTKSETIVFEASDKVPSYLHPGQSAQILSDGEVVGLIGALHPQILKTLGISKPVYVFEITQSALVTAALPAFKVLSRQPEVSRDLAILIDKQWSVSQIGGEIRKQAGNSLKQVRLFDEYSGQGIDPTHRSLAFNLTFQDPSRTLKDTEINTAMEKVVAGLESQFNASLR